MDRAPPELPLIPLSRIKSNSSVAEYIPLHTCCTSYTRGLASEMQHLFRFILGIKRHSTPSCLYIPRPGTYVNYSLTQAFTSSSDVAYKAVSSSAEAAHSLALSTDHRKKATQTTVYAYPSRSACSIPNCRRCRKTVPLHDG